MIAASLLLSSGLTLLNSQIPAFPGAEGHGRYVSGGRGGIVSEVTNLADSGDGSLRAAIEASGARTIVFRVSGTIRLESSLTIRNDNITIAGQTAPGDGITIRDFPVLVGADNVIIRFLRFRMGDEAEQEADALGGRYHKSIMVDHCSMSWSTDECVSFYINENFTLQWSIISESLRISVHDKGAHGYGGIWGGRKASFHHNLLAHHDSRNPRLGEARGDAYALTDLVDLRNNVIYNWGGNSCYGGEAMNVNIVNCYYKAGPATSAHNRIIAIDKLMEHGYPISDTWGKFYIDGNHLTASAQASEDNWTYGVYNQFHSNYGTVTQEEKEAMRIDLPHNPGEIVTHSAEEAYSHVLKHGGASLVRDTVDLRILHDVRTGTASYMDGGNGSTNGIIDTQAAVGDWPVLNSIQSPVDSDSDGMPDDWETDRGLNPDDPEDRNGDRIGDGYTNLEEYLNGLVKLPWDLEPMIKTFAPLPGSGYFLNDTVPVEAISSFHGGSIGSFQLFVDGSLRVSTDTSVMDTFLTDLTPGLHLLTFRSTDDRGNTTADSLKIYLGSVLYDLTLIPGSGEGEVITDPPGTSFMEGTEVTIHANPQFTYLFRDWTGDVQSSENPLVLTMDSAIELSANFVRDTGIYTRINFQPSGSEVPPGYLPDAGDLFGLRDQDLSYGWVGSHNYEAIQRSGVDDPRKATFNQMQKNGAATWELEVPDGHYAVNVHMGDGRSTSQVNSLMIEGIEMTDTIAGNYFDEYYLANVEVNDGALTLVPTGENAKINFIKIGPEACEFGRYLTVIKGQVDGDYPVGSEVEVRADPAGPDYDFLEWTGDTSHLADTRSAVTTLTMPGKDVVLTANYWIPAYTLTVNNGTGSGTYSVGETVYIIAGTPPEGQSFFSWDVVKGDSESIANRYASFTWIIMPPENMEVMASFEDITGVFGLPGMKNEAPNLYPNPARDEFFIQMDQSGKTTIRIFNFAGQMVQSEVHFEKVQRVNTQQLPSGIYQVLVSDERGRTFGIKLCLN